MSLDDDCNYLTYITYVKKNSFSCLQYNKHTSEISDVRKPSITYNNVLLSDYNVIIM